MKLIEKYLTEYGLGDELEGDVTPADNLYKIKGQKIEDIYYLRGGEFGIGSNGLVIKTKKGSLYIVQPKGTKIK